MRNLDFSTKVFRLLMLVLLLFSVQISRADEGWPRTLKGRIVDAKSGETLIGVNIQILGTTTGTISDFDGGFQLVVKGFFVKFGGNLFFISTVSLFFFLNPIKSCRYVCFLVTLKTPHH